MARPSITEIFSGVFGGNNQQQQTLAGNAPVSNPVQKAPASQEAAFQPGTGQNPKQQTPTEPPSPLDEFKDLFTMEESKEGEEKYDPDAPLFALDPAKLKDLSGQQKFYDAESMAELATKATSGDSQALMQMMNIVAQNAFQKAAEFSTTVANRTASTAMERGSKNLPSQVKNLLSRDALDGLNPAFNHPSLAPMVHAVKDQITAKYPEASPKQIADLTNRYLTNAAAQLKAPDVPNPATQVKPEQEWGEFFQR